MLLTLLAHLQFCSRPTWSRTSHRHDGGNRYTFPVFTPFLNVRQNIKHTSSPCCWLQVNPCECLFTTAWVYSIRQQPYAGQPHSAQAGYRRSSPADCPG